MRDDQSANHKSYVAPTRNWKPGLTTKPPALASGIAKRIEELGKLNDRYLQAHHDRNAIALLEIAHAYEEKGMKKRGHEIRIVAARISE